jgi:glutathione S-transferase
MRLYYSPTSPFVRKVMVLAQETGLVDQLELNQVTISPVNPDTELNADNPLGKVPCLITDEGMAIFDSRVICEYLDGLHDGPRMIPAAGPERWRTMRIHALCDGILEATILCLYERRLRSETMVFEGWIEAQMAKVHRAIAALADEMSNADDQVNMAAIAAACVLGYMDFRQADMNWREDYPAMAEWYGNFGERSSMQATVPLDP